MVSRDRFIRRRIAELMRRQDAVIYQSIHEEMQRKPELKDKSQRFARRLEAVSKEGVPSISTAPYYMVVTERKGFPPVG